MLATQFLLKYPTPSVMDRSMDTAFENAARKVKGSFGTQALSFFRVFLDVGGLQLHSIGVEQSLHTLLPQFCGFLYEIKIGSEELIFNIIRAYGRLLGHLCDELAISQPSLPKVSKRGVTDDVEVCIDEFRKLKLDQSRMDYYIGWVADCSVGGSQFWNLSHFHEQYGPELTKQLWVAIKAYCNKTIPTTAQNYSSQLFATLETITRLYNTEAKLRFAGSPRNINATVRSIFACQLINARQEGRKIENFYKVWKQRVKLIEKTLIEPGIWSEPPLPLWCPSFKTSPTNAGTHKKIDEQGNAFNDKLVTHIPLSCTDDQAIEALLESINKDLNHVVDACRQQVDLTMANFAKRKELAALGGVKRRGARGAVNMKMVANQCATWEHYTFDCPVNTSYPNFLGFNGSVSTFAQNYALLTPYTLYPFLYLLINEHPAITDSWLLNFELYDENGKKSGFRQSGSIWVAESIKRRRGEENAQQPVKLNKTAKELFDDIIALTEQARRYLKEKGDDDWRYLLLSSKTGVSKPARMKNLLSFGVGKLPNAALRHAIAWPSANADAERAEGILDNLSLTIFRGSCGVQVYLKTRSVKAMSEALGHANYNPKLLSYYLPEPILRYFQSRWVRIFQNALVYEAMKDNELLLEALDFGEAELDEFLRNHKLKPLPAHLMTGHVSDFTGNNDTGEKALSDNASIPISTPVLQVMNCLVDLVEKANKSRVIKEVAARWYETSKYVLESISTQNDCPDIEKAMADAVANPLPAEKLMGAVYAS